MYVLNQVIKTNKIYICEKLNILIYNYISLLTKITTYIIFSLKHNIFLCKIDLLNLSRVKAERETKSRRVYITHTNVHMHTNICLYVCVHGKALRGDLPKKFY